MVIAREVGGGRGFVGVVRGCTTRRLRMLPLWSNSAMREAGNEMEACAEGVLLEH